MVLSICVCEFDKAGIGREHAHFILHVMSFFEFWMLSGHSPHLLGNSCLPPVCPAAMLPSAWVMKPLCSLPQLSYFIDIELTGLQLRSFLECGDQMDATHYHISTRISQSYDKSSWTCSLKHSSLTHFPNIHFSSHTSISSHHSQKYARTLEPPHLPSRGSVTPCISLGAAWETVKPHSGH